MLISAMGTTTTIPAVSSRVVPIQGVGHSWFDWSLWVFAASAATTGTVWLIAGLRSLWRDRMHLQILNPRIGPRKVAGRVEVWIEVHIAPGSRSWVNEQFDVSCTGDGKDLDAIWRSGSRRPEMGSEPFNGELVFDMNDPPGDTVDFRIVYKFRDHRRGEYTAHLTIPKG
jgi:hypothetical protein